MAARMMRVIEISEPERSERERTEQRYRIYELRACSNCDGAGSFHQAVVQDGKPVGFRAGACRECNRSGYQPVCVATVETLQAIGPCLAQLAEDDRAAGVKSPPARGVLDDLEGHWICSLWPEKVTRRRAA